MEESLRIAFHNVTTGDIEEREMTIEESETHLEERQKSIDLKNAEIQKDLDRQIILDKLGLSAEELNLILNISLPLPEVLDPVILENSLIEEVITESTFLTSGPPADQIIS